MEHKLTIMARDGAMTWELDEWTVLVALTTLSAQPETLGQVAEAMRRYLLNHRLLEEGTALGSSGAVSESGPWCLIELVGRNVVAGGGFELPDPNGAYQANERDEVDGFPIVWLDTPGDWRFFDADADSWEVVRQRVVEAASETPLDARRVLFGKTMLAFLSKRVLAAARHDAALDDERRLEQTRAIHADWLMTPRGDLGGRSPREILLSDRERIDREIERRSQQWSRQREAPPPLATDTPAYRFGRFGTVQIALYFDLIRALFEHAWTQVERQPLVSPEVLTERLADERDHWVSSPQEESGCSLTPAEQIELESRRMPVTGDHSPIDCDCPLCLEMASADFGPSFMWFDGHHLELENEFAFSLIESRGEWERRQAEWRDVEQEWDAEDAERNASENEDDGDTETSAWQSSFVNWEMLDDPETPPGMPKMAIGFLLAELVTALKHEPDGRAHLEELNQAYLRFRSAEDRIATHSAAEEIRECLERVARAYPDLVAKSADLQSRLDEVLRATAATAAD